MLSQQGDRPAPADGRSNLKHRPGSHTRRRRLARIVLGEEHPAKGTPRHPVVEDDVVIYGGATVLGRITIGKGSIIGGNVWLTQSVPPGSRA